MKDHSLGQALADVATPRRLKNILAIAVTLLALMFAALALYEYRRASSDALRALDQIGRIVHEHAIKALESNETVLDRFMEMLGDRSAESLRQDEESLHALIVQMTQRFGQLRNLMLWDEHGVAVVSRRYYPVRRDVSIADRAFFIRHQRQGIGTSINEPLDGRFGGERIFNMSKVRRDRDGGFAGVASVSFSPQYFSDFYRQAVGSDGVIAIALLRSDGEVVARYPGSRQDSDSWPGNALKAAMKDGAAHGVATAVVGLDGERQYVAFRKVESYPLFIVVSRTHSSVFFEWRHDMASIALFLLPCVGIMIAAIWLAITRGEKEYEAILRLHEEEVKRADAEDHLRQLEKYEALGQLTGGLTHDFNNLLQIISSNTAAIRAMPPGTDRQPQLGAIDRAISRGRALTTHLLAFARRRELALERVQPGAVVPGMLGLARHSLPGTITLRCAVESDVWDVNADCAELELAILNMTLNARDAMKDGGVITVQVRNVARSSTERLAARLPEIDLVALSVSDTGTGIPEAILHRVFEPFFTTKQEKGTGLGLSRVYGYASQLGGTAVAGNARGGGAVVTMYIPRYMPTGGPLKSESGADGPVALIAIKEVADCSRPSS